jgi:hypothetical protein
MDITRRHSILTKVAQAYSQSTSTQGNQFPSPGMTGTGYSSQTAINKASPVMGPLTGAMSSMKGAMNSVMHPPGSAPPAGMGAPVMGAMAGMAAPMTARTTRGMAANGLQLR